MLTISILIVSVLIVVILLVSIQLVVTLLVSVLMVPLLLLTILVVSSRCCSIRGISRDRNAVLVKHRECHSHCCEHSR